MILKYPFVFPWGIPVDGVTKKQIETNIKTYKSNNETTPLEDFGFWVLEKKLNACISTRGELIHDAGDALGLIPGAGDIIDGLNGLVYLTEGDIGNFVITFLALIPVIGEAGPFIRKTNVSEVIPKGIK